MWWMSLVVTSTLSAAEPCEAPRVRDTAPLVAAIAQDKVMAQTFTKAATACAERGEACDQARLECSTLLASTIQKQVGFDEGQWLRDMLLPYNGGSYPMTRSFGAAPLAGDASCNVDVATLTASAQRRTTQATRRDGLFQEYQGYARWTQTQLQKCKERVAADEAKSAATRAESERLAAASAAAAAAEAAKQKAAQEAAAAKLEAERKAREAAEAEAKKREEAERAAKDEREKERARAEAQAAKAEEDRKAERRAAEERADRLDRERKEEKRAAEEKLAKEKELSEQRVQAAKEEAEQKAREAEEKRLVGERDKRITEQRATKERLVRDAEANLKRAKDEEALKKQAAVDAVSSSPAIAQAAVAEAAQAEKARVDAEKKLLEAQQKADAIVIDDSFERSSGSVGLAGGGAASDGGFGLGVMGVAHFGFWGTAPSEGMASGFELRLWGRYFGTVATMTPAASIEALVSARYYFGRVAVGVAGELGLSGANFAAVRGGAGPALGVALVDNHETRVLLNASYLPVGNVMDPLRIVGDFEVSWRFLTLQVHGSTVTRVVNGANSVGWQVGGFAGVRASW